MQNEEPEAAVIVTEDRWMKDPDSRDFSDNQIVREASQNGRPVRVINVREMLEEIRDKDPKSFEALQKVQKQSGSKVGELIELARLGNERLEEFTELTKSMGRGQATRIRIFRVEQHMTWRGVARACSGLQWPNLRGWQPPSNQIMGMVLCERAAAFFNENFREPPWN